MSLRRRIAGVVAVAVATIAILIGAFGYLSTRSQLLSGVRQELSQRASDLVDRGAAHGGGTLFGAGHRGSSGASNLDADSAGFGLHAPPTPAFGGAPGYVQIVTPSGGASTPFDGSDSVKLPVSSAVRRAAKGRGSRFYFDAKVNGHHLEILTVPNRSQGEALEIALPLTDVDRDLSSLLVTYAIIVGGGVLFSILFALVVARAAIAPIGRFITATAQVTRALGRPRRLEETGAQELRHLAVYFNQTLEALERSVAAQRHLIADASHELRTPLAALRSNIQIFLEAERLPPEERAELQEAIVAEVDDLTQVVSDVLELARGAAPSERVEQVELDGLVRDAVSRSQRRAPGLVFDLDIEPTLIMNSPERVGRAVQNVIDNARKWSPPEGTVHLSLSEGTLSVRDHGPGFREEDLPAVFDRFFRADDARRMPGSGLGLAIVKQAAEAHGGFARAANAPDGGALVTVSFGPGVGSGDDLVTETGGSGNGGPVMRKLLSPSHSVVTKET